MKNENIKLDPNIEVVSENIDLIAKAEFLTKEEEIVERFKVKIENPEENSFPKDEFKIIKWERRTMDSIYPLNLYQ